MRYEDFTGPEAARLFTNLGWCALIGLLLGLISYLLTKKGDKGDP